MTELRSVVELTWKMRLTDTGYTCYELVDQGLGLRFGWVVNAATVGWGAHVGPWGQSDPSVDWIDQRLETWETATTAREWVEAELARQWKSVRRK